MNHIRAIFGIGLVYLGKRDLKKAGYVFERLLSIEDSFGPEHKHLFNEFGIGLRKTRLHAQAIEYYGRALAYCDDDENLHFDPIGNRLPGSRYPNVLRALRDPSYPPADRGA